MPPQSDDCLWRLNMKYTLEIDRKIVELVNERDRYHNGDLQDLEADKWLKELAEIERDIGFRIALAVMEQLPAWEPSK